MTRLSLARTKKRYTDKLMKEGKCYSCAKPREDLTKTLCNSCAEKNRIRNRENKRIKKFKEQ